MERNVTNSGEYLEALSVRYKKQIEDLQMAVKKSNEALAVSSKYRQQERIAVNLLSKEVANLTDRVSNLTTYMETMSVGAVYVHAFFLLLEIFVGIFFLLICCRRYKDTVTPSTKILSTEAEKTSNDVIFKSTDCKAPVYANGITELGSGLYIQQSQTKDSSTEKETDISSTQSSSPLKRNERRLSLEDLSSINEEECPNQNNPMSSGEASHLNRRNSMIVLSEPPPLTRKQRKRQHRKQFQAVQSDNRSLHHSRPSILSENVVEDVKSGYLDNQTPRIIPVTSVSSHYHTIHSSPKENTTVQMPWKQITRSGSVDNLHVRTKAHTSRADVDERNNHRQPEQDNRFVVQPVVNVYLNSLVSDPLETSNKYGLLNNSLHDDPTPIKERSLNYGIETTCDVIESHNVLPKRQKSKSSHRKKQLFSDLDYGAIENGTETPSAGSEDTNEKSNIKIQSHSKIKRSKSSSPKRVGQNVKQRVLFENFNPDNADWIHKH